MKRPKLPTWAPLALWPAGGAVAGLLLGALVTSPSTALALLVPVVALVAVASALAGAYWGAKRLARSWEERRASRAAEDASRGLAAAPAPRAGALALAIRWADIPEGAPDVWGAGDALRVRVIASRDGRPAQGARVEVFLVAGDATNGERRMIGGPLAVGADGALDLPVVIPQTGEVHFQAEATAAEGGQARAERALRLVRYADEVQAIFNDFRAWANAKVPGCRDALTAREVADILTPGASPDASRALAEVARIYELVAYGERAADRGLYIALLRAFNDLEDAGIFARFEGKAAARGA